VDVPILIAAALVCASSAITLILDEIWDHHKRGPEYGLKWSDLGKLSHETAIAILLTAAAALVAYHFV